MAVFPEFDPISSWLNSNLNPQSAATRAISASSHADTPTECPLPTSSGPFSVRLDEPYVLKRELCVPIAYADQIRVSAQPRSAQSSIPSWWRWSSIPVISSTNCGQTRSVEKNGRMIKNGHFMYHEQVQHGSTFLRLTPLQFLLQASTSTLDLASSSTVLSRASERLRNQRTSSSQLATR